MADRYEIQLLAYNPNAGVPQRHTEGDYTTEDGKIFGVVQTYNSVNMAEDGISGHEKKTDFSMRTYFTNVVTKNNPSTKLKGMYASLLHFGTCDQRFHTDDPKNYELIKTDPGWCDNGYAEQILMKYENGKWEDIPQVKWPNKEKPTGNVLQWTKTYEYQSFFVLYISFFHAYLLVLFWLQYY